MLNRNGLECDGLETLCIKDQSLTIDSKHLPFQTMNLFMKQQVEKKMYFLFFFYVYIHHYIESLLSCPEGAEKAIGWALSHHLMQNSEADPDSRLVLSSER